MRRERAARLIEVHSVVQARGELEHPRAVIELGGFGEDSRCSDDEHGVGSRHVTSPSAPDNNIAVPPATRVHATVAGRSAASKSLDVLQGSAAPCRSAIADIGCPTASEPTSNLWCPPTVAVLAISGAMRSCWPRQDRLGPNCFLDELAGDLVEPDDDVAETAHHEFHRGDGFNRSDVGAGSVCRTRGRGLGWECPWGAHASDVESRCRDGVAFRRRGRVRAACVVAHAGVVGGVERESCGSAEWSVLERGLRCWHGLFRGR